MRLVILLGLILFQACAATPYEPMGSSGGYEDSQVGADMYEVTFKGNGYSSNTRTLRYMKRRCAELALSKGFTHYIVVSESESGYERFTNRATIKLIKNPVSNVVAYEAKQVMKSTEDKE